MFKSLLIALVVAVMFSTVNAKYNIMDAYSDIISNDIDYALQAEELPTVDADTLYINVDTVDYTDSTSLVYSVE